MVKCLILFQQAQDGSRQLIDVVPPLPHNYGWWARRLRGEARALAKQHPDNSYCVACGRREFFRADGKAVA